MALFVRAYVEGECEQRDVDVTSLCLYRESRIFYRLAIPAAVPCSTCCASYPHPPGGRVNLARRTSCQREPESARARGAVRPATIYSCQYSAPVLYVPFARVSYARAPCSVTSGRGGYCCTLFRGYTWPPSTVCTRLRLKHCTHLLARAGSLTGDTLIKSSRFENRANVQL